MYNNTQELERKLALANRTLLDCLLKAVHVRPCMLATCQRKTLRYDTGVEGAGIRICFSGFESSWFNTGGKITDKSWCCAESRGRAQHRPVTCERPGESNKLALLTKLISFELFTSLGQGWRMFMGTHSEIAFSSRKIFLRMLQPAFSGTVFPVIPVTSSRRIGWRPGQLPVWSAP